MMYGTAWKEGRTEALTLRALELGFRAIDTANQRKHYFEEAVGMALKSFLKSKRVERSELSIQTKFTHQQGQDHRLPYNPESSVTDQVLQSFESSLKHLGLDYIDSYLLHGPSSAFGVAPEDFEAWSSMESLALSGQTRHLGLSNVNLNQLESFYKNAKVKPKFVQNRCYASQGWDYSVRKFCRENGIQYQGFSLLTANLREIQHPKVLEISKNHRKTLPQVIFRFSQQMGILPLTGTSDEKHMREDLAISDFELDSRELEIIERIAKSY